MAKQLFLLRFGPNDGESIAVDMPAPARIIIDESDAIFDVSHRHHYPCYVRYVVEHEGNERFFYEYEGEPPLRA